MAECLDYSGNFLPDTPISSNFFGTKVLDLEKMDETRFAKKPENMWRRVRG